MMIYYLPGHGGEIGTGLGEGLRSRGFDVAGRETRNEFLSLSFGEQVAVVVNDLQSHFWQDNAKVVCVSFGAYLFLHAQSQLPSFPGKVLLLSPIMGEFRDDTTSRGFIPPRAGKLMQLAEEGRFRAPRLCEIHVGAEDWQSRPEVVKRFGAMTGISTTVVAGRGHDLGPQYVASVLDGF